MMILEGCGWRNYESFELPGVANAKDRLWIQNCRDVLFFASRRKYGRV